MIRAFFAVFLMSCSNDEATLCLSDTEGTSREDRVAACRAAFEKTGEPRYGLRAVELLLQEAARVEGTPEEFDVLDLVAKEFYRVGEYLEAAEHWFEAAEGYRSLGELAESSRARRNVAGARWHLGENGASLESAFEAHRDATAAEDRSGALRSLMIALPNVYGAADYDATQWLLSVIEPHWDEMSRDQRRDFYNTRGVTRLQQGKFELALADLGAATALLSEEDSPVTHRRTLLNLAFTEMKRGNLQEAGRYLAMAWERAEEDGEAQHALLAAESQLLRLQGDAAGALEACARGLSIEDAPTVWRMELLVETSLAQRDLGRIEGAESSLLEGIELLDELRDTLDFNQLKAASASRRREAYEVLADLYVRSGRSFEAMQVIARSKSAAVFDAQLNAGSGSVTVSSPADVIDRFGNRAFFAAPLTKSRSTGERSKARLDGFADPRSAVFTYLVLEDSTLLVALHSDRVSSRVLEIGRDELELEVLRFLENPNETLALGRLGELLVPPELLQEVDTLIVVPDGALTRLPFSALRLDDRFLIESVDVSYLPSLASTPFGAERKTGGRRIVLGDPQENLPYARDEAKTVSQIVGGELYLGVHATGQRVLEADRPDLLHIASHASFQPGGSSIRLAGGPLYSEEVVAAGVAPRLTVLTNCVSASGTSANVWGSLAGAFFVSGSESVVAALWSIEDAAAKRFSESFYLEHQGLSAPLQAVAETQRALIRQHTPISEWAAYVHLGSNRERESS